MSELVSEPIEPFHESFDTAAMSRGEPGLPSGFTWRGQRLAIARQLSAWKESSPEGGVGELYLRRHYYQLLMSDGAVWTVYFTRQAPRGRPTKQRWFLYTIEADEKSQRQKVQTLNEGPAESLSPATDAGLPQRG